MMLVALYAEDGQERRKLGSGLHEEGKGGATRTQRLLGSTWLPVSSSVMERGHVEDGYDRESALTSTTVRSIFAWS